MVPTTKEAERAELHKTIWRIANDLRGSVDGWDFKAYVLVYNGSTGSSPRTSRLTSTSRSGWLATPISITPG